MDQQLKPFDLYRIFIGQSPGWFMLEVIVRIVLIYAVLLIAMRMMGKRVAAQMSVSELAVIVTLGAAVGVPMQVPDRGMLPAILILGVAVLFQRGVAVLGFRNRNIETVMQGDVNVLVQDGRIFSMKCAKPRSRGNACSRCSGSARSNSSARSGASISKRRATSAFISLPNRSPAFQSCRGSTINSGTPAKRCPASSPALVAATSSRAAKNRQTNANSAAAP